MNSYHMSGQSVLLGDQSKVDIFMEKMLHGQPVIMTL